MSAIHFDITGDNDNIMSVIDQTTKGFEELANYMKKLGDSGLDLSNSEKSIETLGEVLSEIMEQMKEWGEELEDLQKLQQEAMMAGDADKVKAIGEEMNVLGEKINIAGNNAVKLEKILGSNEKGKKILEELGNDAGEIAPELDKSSEAASNLFKTLVPGLAKIGSIAGIVSILRKVANDAISLTQRVGDTWGREVAGWQSTYESFVRSIGSGKGWTQMIQDAARAYTIGKKVFDLMDELFEMQNSLTLAESKYSGEIEENRQIMMDSTKSYKERKEAAQGIIDAEEKLGKMRQKVADQRLEAATLDLEKDTNLTADERKFFIEQYNDNQELISQARKYGEAIKGLEINQAAYEQTFYTSYGNEKQAREEMQKQIDAYNKTISETSDSVKEAFEIMSKYDEGSDKVIGAWVEAAAAANRVTTETTRATRRATTTLNRIELEEKKANQAFADVRRQNSIKLAREIRNNALEQRQAEIDGMKDGNGKVLAQIDLDYQKEKQAIQDWYDDLREEKIRKARELWNANPNNAGKVFTYNPNSSKWNATEQEQILFNQKNSSLDYKYSQDRKRAINATDDTLNAYLKEYGTYWEKRWAIRKEYQDKINATDDKWQKRLLEREKQAELMQLENSRFDYLKEYGTYSEKLSAITESYKNQIKVEPDEYKRNALYKQMTESIKDLNKEYSSTYSLIFADANTLSGDMLAKAIEATQNEIEKARESGDIQALTQLYEKLREQMDVNFDRNNWGFGGLSIGYQALADAKRKRELAKLFDSMEADDSGIDWKQEAKTLFDESLLDEQQGANQIYKSISQIGNAFSELGRELEQFEGPLGDIGKTFSAIGSQADTIGKALSGQMNMASAVSASISGVIQLLGMVLTSIEANKKAQEQWNLTIADADNKYRMLMLDALDYKQRNIFGIENPYQKAIDGAMQYSSAMEALNEQIESLRKGQIQTDTKKVIDWGNVGKGTAIGAGAGAAIGSVIPGLGTLLGGAIGAAIGAITGALSTKVVPVFESLEKKYGELFNPDTYELNDRLLADYEKLDDATKQIVDNWNDIVAKAKEAEQQMRETFHDLAGDVGNQLSQSLVEAFRNGNLNSAIEDFHKKMTSTIEDILSKLVFSATFGKMFDKLEERMAESFGVGGDQDIVDDLIWMEEEYKSKLDQYNAAMAQVQSSLGNLGYDIFKGDSYTQTATAGGFQTMSQDTASELNGRFTALQLSNELISQSAQAGVEFLSNISGMVTSGDKTLGEIRDLHVLEVGYLEDISKYTKTMAGFEETLNKIEKNTSKL